MSGSSYPIRPRPTPTQRFYAATITLHPSDHGPYSPRELPQRNMEMAVLPSSAGAARRGHLPRSWWMRAGEWTATNLAATARRA